MGNSVRQKCATPFGAEYTLYVKTVGVVENDTDESSTCDQRLQFQVIKQKEAQQKLSDF